VGSFLADGYTTYDAIGRGCVEANPIFKDASRESLLIGSAALAGLLWYFRAGVPEEGLWLLAGLKGSAAVWNANQDCN